jgi:intracellular septation protein A
MTDNKFLKKPSIIADVATSICISAVICIVLGGVFYLFGNAQKIDTRITSLFGAILAFSGLMTKQYLLKENIEYFHKWKKVEETIDSISLNENDLPAEARNITTSLLEQNNRANFYIQYIVAEIKIIPIIPLLLVVLYGAALIASEAQWFSITCLSLMLLLVSYLAQATITSNNLAIDTSDLDETS